MIVHYPTFEQKTLIVPNNDRLNKHNTNNDATQRYDETDVASMAEMSEITFDLNIKSKRMLARFLGKKTQEKKKMGVHPVRVQHIVETLEYQPIPDVRAPDCSSMNRVSSLWTGTRERRDKNRDETNKVVVSVMKTRRRFWQAKAKKVVTISAADCRGLPIRQKRTAKSKETCHKLFEETREGPEPTSNGGEGPKHRDQLCPEEALGVQTSSEDGKDIRAKSNSITTSEQEIVPAKSATLHEPGGTLPWLGIMTKSVHTPSLDNAGPSIPSNNTAFTQEKISPTKSTTLPWWGIVTPRVQYPSLDSEDPSTQSNGITTTEEEMTPTSSIKPVEASTTLPWWGLMTKIMLGEPVQCMHCHEIVYKEDACLQRCMYYAEPRFRNQFLHQDCQHQRTERELLKAAVLDEFKTLCKFLRENNKKKALEPRSSEPSSSHTGKNYQQKSSLIAV